MNLSELLAATDDARGRHRCRYSAFMSASLVVAAVTTTSAFLRALSFVKDLSECSRAESECLYNVQRWFYRRLVSGLVKVDVEVFELQAAGICRTLRTGDVEQLLESRWTTNLATAEVLPCRCCLHSFPGVLGAPLHYPASCTTSMHANRSASACPTLPQL